MTLSINSVPSILPGTFEETAAEDLVTERFDLAKTLAQDQVNAAHVYLTSLQNLFASATMPDSDISYDFQNITLESDITSHRPEAPSDADLTPGDVTVPVAGTLNEITVPTISIPTYTLVAPTDELAFFEPIYQSDLQNALKVALEDFVENGGTGLSSDVEDALWTRSRARQALLNERTYNEAEEYFASRGYTIPPGALGGRLTEALAEQTRADALLNDEITIKQAELARAQSEYTMNAAINLEGQDKEKFNAMASRTLEAAKATVQVVLNLYDGKVKEYIAKVEATKLIVEAEKIKVDAAVAANSSTIEAYKADVDKYKTQLLSEIAIVEQIAKVYGFKIAGYEADAKVATLELDAQIKAYQGNIEQANNQTAMTLKEAELTVQSYLGALQLTAGSIEASGNISAQIAASALSAVNASASLGHATSWNKGYDFNWNQSLSNSASLGESHSYDETAI